MELRECLVCQSESLYSGKVPEYSWTKNEEMNADCESIKIHLHTIFLLRKFLDIPEDKCCSFLEDYGNPSLWFYCCTSCSKLVEEAKRVFQQIVTLQKQYEELQKKFKKEIVESVMRQTNFKKTVRDSVRSYIKQEYDNCTSISTSQVKTETFTKLATEEIDDLYFLHSDHSIAENTFTETETESHFMSDKIVNNVEMDDPLALALEDRSTSLFLNDSEMLENVSQECNKSDDEFSYIEDSSSCSEASDSVTAKMPFEDDTQNSTQNSAVSESDKEKRKEEILQFRRTCTKCGMECISDGQLKIHQETHKDWNPLSCQVCGKTFTNKWSLKAHLKSHSGEKNYKCGICGRGFATNHVCKAHEKIHSGERPYSCHVCGKTFSREYSCKEHVKLFHMQCICKLCGESVTRRNIVAHHKRMHPVK